ncbi:MAG: pectinesterase family protein, partial [Acetatifactor muris]|nr:pectinesterase family protein [Acetatifactor muris]
MNRETIHLYVNMPGHTPVFPTVAAALESIQAQEPEKTYPAFSSDIAPAVVHIGSGIYREKLVITRPNLTLLGEGKSRDDTVLVWGDGAFDLMPEGDKRGTFRTASVRIDTHDFTARHLTFQNDAGYGRDAGQALALYVDGDRIYFEDCRLLGSQDTLFTAPLPLKEAIPGGFKGPGADRPRIMGRHCFRGCMLQGDVDFIFGGGIAWFENCVLFSKLPEPESPAQNGQPAQLQTAPGSSRSTQPQTAPG